MNPELLDHYSSYLTEEITHEQLTSWVQQQVFFVWKNDGPIVALAREFDDEKFSNPKSELVYRLLNLEMARYIQSNIAIGRNAFAASRVAVEKLNDYGVGLNLILEALKAYQHLSPELPTIMICYDKVQQFFKRNITNESSRWLRENYNKLLDLTCKLPANISHRHRTFEAIEVTLFCLNRLLSLKYDRALVQKTISNITTRIFPYFTKPDQYKIELLLREVG